MKTENKLTGDKIIGIACLVVPPGHFFNKIWMERSVNCVSISS